MTENSSQNGRNPTVNQLSEKLTEVNDVLIQVEYWFDTLLEQMQAHLRNWDPRHGCSPLEFGKLCKLTGNQGPGREVVNHILVLFNEAKRLLELARVIKMGIDY